MTSTTLTDADPFAGIARKNLPMNAKSPRSLAEAFVAESILEPKYDGWRILAYVGANEVKLYSRTGNRYDGQVPLIEGELLANFPEGTWLDGEIVAMTIDGDRVNVEWGLAQSVMSTTRHLHPRHGDVSYVAFDLLSHPTMAPVLAEHVGREASDSDLRGYPLRLRRAALDACFCQGDFRYVMQSPALEPTEASHDANLAQGFEGSVVKSLNASYLSGQRGGGWWKLKPQATIDAIIMGYKEGENSFTGLVGAIVFGQYATCESCNGSGSFNGGNACPDCGGSVDSDSPTNGKVLTERGRCSGMTMKVREEISADRDGFLGRVVEIAHMGVSIGSEESGRFRHPQFKRFRDDKLPEQVTLHD